MMRVDILGAKKKKKNLISSKWSIVKFIHVGFIELQITLPPNRPLRMACSIYAYIYLCILYITFIRGICA